MKDTRNKFHLEAPYTPIGDQSDAISKLTNNIKSGTEEQVLLGVTGSGKTFTLANVIQQTQRPTLVISHNKTLAAQLYQEFRDYFPQNAVSYFVSYYDYYQPEAYIPQTDTYIEKETEINEEIDKLRLAATTNILTRNDTIIIASVSCIYNIGSPKEYGNFVLELQNGVHVTRESIFKRLVQLQYERNDYGFHRGSFRVRGEIIDIFPAYSDSSIRIIMDEKGIISLEEISPLTGKKIFTLEKTVIYPAKHYMTDTRSYKKVFSQIEHDMHIQKKEFTKKRKFIEAQRIEQKITYDLEMIAEMGYVNGIENYSRYFDGRSAGDPPYTLFDYFRSAYGDNWLLCIDESHMTIPQIRGMYNGDRSRKQTLIDYGFRLPAALDNRPLRFDEFLRNIPQTIYLSATPDDWEMERVQPKNIIEQLVRPTGLLDPIVHVRPLANQIQDLYSEIQKRVLRKERVLVTTLTKQMAEDLSEYLKEKQVNVHYLHSDILTLERMDILADLRKGTYDVIVGVNLLREGLDLPEVSLVAILDADKEGFLRSRTSLIQTMGRAARHASGEVILYADIQTKSIKNALDEVGRRRKIQQIYNKRYDITPQTIQKPIRDRLVEQEKQPEDDRIVIDERELESMTPQDKTRYIKRLKRMMQDASRNMQFELAAEIRDRIARITGNPS